MKKCLIRLPDKLAEAIFATAPWRGVNRWLVETIVARLREEWPDEDWDTILKETPNE